MCVQARMGLKKQRVVQPTTAKKKKLKFVKLIRRETQIAPNLYEFVFDYTNVLYIYICIYVRCHECDICVWSCYAWCEVHAVLIKYVFVHFDVYFGS